MGEKGHRMKYYIIMANLICWLNFREEKVLSCDMGYARVEAGGCVKPLLGLFTK